MQTEDPWPDPRSGPWLLRISYAADAEGRVVPVGLELWGIPPPTERRWTAWHVTVASEAAPLTSAALRIPLGRLTADLRAQAARFLPTLRRSGRAGVEALEAALATRPRRGRPPTYNMGHWEAIAAAYRAADKAPTQAIADGFHVSRATASRWVARCRAEGLLSTAVD